MMIGKRLDDTCFPGQMIKYSALCKIIIIPLIAIFGLLPLSLSAESVKDSTDLAADSIRSTPSLYYGYSYMQYFYRHDVQTFDLSISSTSLLWNNRLEHNFMWGCVSLVKQGRYLRYSFKFPVTVLTLEMIIGLNKIFLGKRYDYDSFMSPFYYILTLPNSTWQLKLRDHLSLSAGAQTDYLLTRDHALDRGILFTPVAGINWSYDMKWCYGIINLSAGYASFWNFEGPDKKYGWGANIIAMFIPLQ
jgi:hypothetical protein